MYPCGIVVGGLRFEKLYLNFHENGVKYTIVHPKNTLMWPWLCYRAALDVYREKGWSVCLFCRLNSKIEMIEILLTGYRETGKTGSTDLTLLNTTLGPKMHF